MYGCRLNLVSVSDEAMMMPAAILSKCGTEYLSVRSKSSSSDVLVGDRREWLKSTYPKTSFADRRKQPAAEECTWKVGENVQYWSGVPGSSLVWTVCGLARILP